MSKSLHSPSFAYGLLAAALIACVIGAVGNDVRDSPKYDASPALGGLGLQIVDHDTNSLYNYKRDKTDDAVTYKLVETIDLSLTGEMEIPVESKE